MKPQQEGNTLRPNGLISIQTLTGQGSDEYSLIAGRPSGATEKNNVQQA
jgi:hypothetical protein